MLECFSRAEQLAGRGQQADHRWVFPLPPSKPFTGSFDLTLRCSQSRPHLHVHPFHPPGFYYYKLSFIRVAFFCNFLLGGVFSQIVDCSCIASPLCSMSFSPLHRSSSLSLPHSRSRSLLIPLCFGVDFLGFTVRSALWCSLFLIVLRFLFSIAIHFSPSFRLSAVVLLCVDFSFSCVCVHRTRASTFLISALFSSTFYAPICYWSQ